MDGSGELSREKDEAVRDLCHAHDEYKTATENLNTLTPLIHGRNEKRVRAVSAALGMQAVPSLDDLRRNTREKLDVLTENTRKLTGKIQDHFPEVIVYVGYGLPPELGGAPLHGLIAGKKNERDRLIVVEQSPRFGVVGRQVTTKFRIEDPAGGTAGGA